MGGNSRPEPALGGTGAAGARLVDEGAISAAGERRVDAGVTGGAGARLVEVAVDAAGVAGGQLFTYRVPASMADLEPGEAVLVEYGRRPSVGLVLGEGEPGALDGRAAKPLLARVHTGDPLLPELGVRLARHIARHYLAPPGMVARAMLPPGMLERVEQIVHATGSPAVSHAAGDLGAPVDAPGSTATRSRAAVSFGDTLPRRPRPGHQPRDLDRLLDVVRSAGDAGIAVDALPESGSRATLLRQLRELQAAGEVELEWRVRPPEAGPRYERTARLTDAGLAASAGESADIRQSSRPLGPRQRELLTDLAQRHRDGDTGPWRAADLASAHGASAVTGLDRRGLIELFVSARQRRPLASRAEPTVGTIPAGADLTPPQRAVVREVERLVDARCFRGLLVEGVAASGKTAIYAASVATAVRAGRGALVLVPEIALAVPLIDRLRHDLGMDIALLHSSLGDGERADEWRRIRSGEARVVVGTRLAVLAPMPSIGVVIVDEEHDPSYKSDRTPRYQARDVALELGRICGAPVLLGSATPDVVSIGQARLGRLLHLRVSERASGARARVDVVDLRAELADGNRGLLSGALVDALHELDREAGERAILVINRRGSASVVLCRDCGYVQVCPECQRPLVFHAAAMALRCHHCGATAPPARRCPACDSPRIRYLGGGTERVEHELAVRLPELRVARLDRDVVERRGRAAAVVDAFTAGEIDVLVGTSMVAKGLDVPQVTLVGVVSADVALNLPDERAAERTWQLLEQAVGRAGRGSLPGRAIIQTYLPDHPAIRAVVTGDAAPFVDAQLALRERFGSAPFGSVIKLTAAMEDRDMAQAAARAMAESLRDRARAQDRQVAVLGPVPAYVARRAGRWRFHVVLRGEDPMSVLERDPGPPWSVDVDPESLL